MSNLIKIAIDAMSGENSPKKIIEGIEISLKKNKENFFYLYGDEILLKKEISPKKILINSCKIINTKDVIIDDESPLRAAKKGKNSSMWKAVEALKDEQTDIALSAGNTGALLVISRLLLNTINGINKPALAALWPNEKNMNVVLDLGANIECSEKNLSDFACMGAALSKSLFENIKPKIALLNVGLEENKGNEILKKTYSILKNNSFKNFEFCGYIEGNQVMDGEIDVIVTDGFTGNIALKTAEGTANFITRNLKKSLNKFSMILSYYSLKTFKEKLDPRKYNGAIFLGLEKPVVKSHGSTDAIGFAHSINVCNKIVKANLIEKIKSNLITVDG
ncbi:phosphate acyltransferase PlsX [Pelagibacteraceae bacterium]|jgi:phosphate acyltransferase|nr:phosphate acyltransferase PlsX [Pelagibacteraceae bacterium]